MTTLCITTQQPEHGRVEHPLPATCIFAITTETGQVEKKYSDLCELNTQSMVTLFVNTEPMRLSLAPVVWSATHSAIIRGLIYNDSKHPADHGDISLTFLQAVLHCRPSNSHHCRLSRDWRDLDQHLHRTYDHHMRKRGVAVIDSYYIEGNSPSSRRSLRLNNPKTEVNLAHPP